MKIFLVSVLISASVGFSVGYTISQGRAKKHLTEEISRRNQRFLELNQVLNHQKDETRDCNLRLYQSLMAIDVCIKEMHRGQSL